jgi:hypothetical protein
VNPNAAGTRDQRTPDELLNIIEEVHQEMISAIQA